MKRAALVFVVVALMCSGASAKGLSFGAKGGIYTANTTQVPMGWDNTAFKNGMAGGLFVNYAFSDILSLQPEVLYVMKGYDGSISNPFYGATLTGKYDYLVIPLLCKITFSSESALSPHIVVGPSLGINLKADIDIDIISRISDERESGSADYSDATNKTELGIVFGAGLGYALGPGRLTLDGRFDLGLTKITKGGVTTGRIGDQDFVEVIPESDNKSIGFALMLGYAF